MAASRNINDTDNTQSQVPSPSRSNLIQFAAGVLLRGFALQFRLRPSLRKKLAGQDGWLSCRISFCTEDGIFGQTVRIHEGRIQIRSGVDSASDATVIYKDSSVVLQMLRLPPNEVLLLLMRGKMRIEGNLSWVSYFNYLLSLPLQKKFKRMLQQATAERMGAGPAEVDPDRENVAPGNKPELCTDGADGVTLLRDPYLYRWQLHDFPRLAKMRKRLFDTVPQICGERSLLLTRWLRSEGYDPAVVEQDAAHNAALRQGRVLKHIMAHKKPLIARDSLLAGSTTAKEVGVVLYPDAHGSLIWGELATLEDRPLNPYRIDDETSEALHKEVFPYWADRNFREWVRSKYDAPLCQQIDERFAVYFAWKTVAFSHTVPDFPLLLNEGTSGIKKRVLQELDQRTEGDQKSHGALQGMLASLEGLEIYAANLAAEAEKQAAVETRVQRRLELTAMARACRNVPATPASTLQEAVQCLWIAWIALHMENTNAGLSLGRLDQWLQPYFASDYAKCSSDDEKLAYEKYAVELIGSFYLSCSDHLPLVPDIGNYLFGGSSSDQAITLGGVTRDGRNAVNDMSYLFLKVTELLRLRDPNVNARVSSVHNDDAFVNRLCEVNLVTAATPSMHGDENVLVSLEAYGSEEDARDWSAIGCVEPTISGKHMGHTGCMMFNLVAPLEMALNDGLHPLMNWKIGPSTGLANEKEFPAFEDFFAAWQQQLSFLVGQAVSYNNMLGEAHKVIRPTPLLSSLITGCIASARDVTSGGAEYNTSGVACIGLADVTDSLSAIKTLVYDKKLVDYATLRQALADDFVGHEKLYIQMQNLVPRFGSGDDGARLLAERVAGIVHQKFSEKKNYRGGRYTTGFWSMSNHVAFGTLTGALPSGRRAAKPFTPGLTPAPGASSNLLDNLHDVARLDPRHMDNNIAFNFKYVPAADESVQDTVEHMRSYVRSYFAEGGMQIQFNVVSSATLRDAMEHPADYPDLLVRISGYNAYFVTLNRDMQLELIERSEFGAVS